jgi:hypothetical protein
MAAAGNDDSKSPIAALPKPPRSPPPGNEGPLVPSAPSGPSLPGKGGPALDSASQNLQSYNEIQKSVMERDFGSHSPNARIRQPLPGSPSDTPRFTFEALRLSGNGFGGVVFGAPLDINKIAKPTKVYWVTDIPATDGAQGWGHFDLVLTDKAVVMTRRLHSDDAYAAWEIVNGRSGVFPALDVGHSEGVGLASVGDLGGAMVVHPALYGLEIGDSAAMADAIGFGMGSKHSAADRGCGCRPACAREGDGMA